mgnify:FL=1
MTKKVKLSAEPVEIIMTMKDGLVSIRPRFAIPGSPCPDCLVGSLPCYEHRTNCRECLGRTHEMEHTVVSVKPMKTRWKIVRRPVCKACGGKTSLTLDKSSPSK